MYNYILHMKYHIKHLWYIWYCDEDVSLHP